MNIIESYKNALMIHLVAKDLKAQFLTMGVENEITALDLDAMPDIVDSLLLTLIHGKETELPFALIKECLHTEEGREILQRAFDASHSIDTEEFTPLDLDLALAVITECSKSDDGIDMLFAVNKRIMPNESSMINSGWWNFFVAYVPYVLDFSSTALYYFERAKESDQQKIDCDEYIQSCITRLSCACFKQNFRQRVQAVWLSFVEQEEYIRNIFNQGLTKRNLEGINKKLIEIFKQVNTAVVVRRSDNGKKFELIITQVADCIRLYAYIYVKEQAPERVLKYWDIVVGVPAMPNRPLVVKNVEITADDVMILLSHENLKFNILAYCAKLQIMGIPEHDAIKYIKDIIRLVIGELAVIAYIGDVQLLDSAYELNDKGNSNPTKYTKSMRLSELPNFLSSQGLSLDIDEYEALESCKRTTIGEVGLLGNLRWRQDIAVVTSSLDWMERSFFIERDYPLKRFEHYGMSAGFIAFPLNSSTGNDVSKEIFNLRLSFDSYLKADGRQAFAKIIGGATGLKYNYLDLIVWDYEGFINEAKNFFLDQGVDKVYFRTFFSGAKTILIKDGDTLPLALVDDLPLDKKRFANSYEAIKYVDSIVGSDQKFELEAEFQAAINLENSITMLCREKRKLEEDSQEVNENAEDSLNNNENNEALDNIKNIYKHEGAKECVEIMLSCYDLAVFDELVYILEGLDRKHWTFKHAMNTVACLLCYGIRSDEMRRVDKYKAERAILRAIDLLQEYESEGTNDVRWNKFMALALSSVSGQEKTAIEYTKKWAKIDSDEEGCDLFLMWLEEKERLSDPTFDNEKESLPDHMIGNEELMENFRENSRESFIRSYEPVKKEFVRAFLAEQKCLDVEALSEILDKSFGKKGRWFRWLKWR